MAGPSLEQMQADKGFQNWATDTGLQKQSDGTWYNPARDVLATYQQQNPEQFAPVAGTVYDIEKNSEGKPLSYNPLISSANIGEKRKRWEELGLQWGKSNNALYNATKSADAETRQQLEDAGYTQGERFTTGTGENAYKYYDASGKQISGSAAQGLEADRQDMQPWGLFKKGAYNAMTGLADSLTTPAQTKEQMYDSWLKDSVAQGQSKEDAIAFAFEMAMAYPDYYDYVVQHYDELAGKGR